MKKSRLIFTAAVLGTGAVMAASFLKPQSTTAPAYVTPTSTKPAVTQIVPVEPASAKAAATATATADTVVAPQTPLFRSATTAAPIDTSLTSHQPAPVRHDAPLLEASSKVSEASGRPPHATSETHSGGMASMTPPPAAAMGLAASEPAGPVTDAAIKSTVPAKSARKPKLANKPASHKPANKRVEALFQHPLGMR